MAALLAPLQAPFQRTLNAAFQLPIGLSGSAGHGARLPGNGGRGRVNSEFRSVDVNTAIPAHRVSGEERSVRGRTHHRRRCGSVRVVFSRDRAECSLDRSVAGSEDRPDFALTLVRVRDTVRFRSTWSCGGAARLFVRSVVAGFGDVVWCRVRRASSWDREVDGTVRSSGRREAGCGVAARLAGGYRPSGALARVVDAVGCGPASDGFVSFRNAIPVEFFVTDPGTGAVRRAAPCATPG